MPDSPLWTGGPVRCYACDGAALVPFVDMGEIPVECGVHWASRADATGSPTGRVVLGYCPECAYVRNVAFDESVVDPTAPTDMNLYHSPAFRTFSSQLVADLAARLPLTGRRVVEVGCAQGEFLRALCRVAGCSGIGFDPSYEGPAGPDPDGSGASFHRAPAPLDADFPEYDLLVSRFVLEHVIDPYGFLVRLREHASDRAVRAHLQVPDAGYDLATAGWEVIYPHVSYFDGYSLCRIAERAGWRVERTGPLFSGLIRYVELTANMATRGHADQPGLADRDRQLAAVRGFAERHFAERRRWHETIERLAASGARPVLWGAGSRGVQLLNFADPKRRLAAVVDVNPAKWGRHLPVTGHRVDEPRHLAEVRPGTVIITNPVYRQEIADSLAAMGVTAEILVA